METSIIDFLGYVLTIFIFVAYMFILFFVLTDLFRDHDLSGWWKALWIVVLIIPATSIIAMIVYLVARGKGMAERSQRAQKAMIDAERTYIREVGGSTPTEQIAQAKQLLDSGVISQEEFDQLKAQVLAS